MLHVCQLVRISATYSETCTTSHTTAHINYESAISQVRGTRVVIFESVCIVANVEIIKFHSTSLQTS